jgi:F-type H+-transporting ATPase subunit b
MIHLLQDANFWVLISFIIFVGVFLKYGKAKVLSSLDDKITKIKSELEQAESMRLEAQTLLCEYQQKHKDAMKDAKEIIANAKAYAEEIRIKTEEELEKTSQRREAQLQEKLERIEQNARHEIEAYTAKIAMDASRKILTESLNEKSDSALIQSTLGSVTKSIN